MKRLENKVAIVTASTQGIGFGIALRFGLEGAAVVISSRKQGCATSARLEFTFESKIVLLRYMQKNVDEAVEKLRAKRIEVMGVVCHVSNAQHRKELVEKTVQKYGRVHIFVSNAAANPSVDNIREIKEAVLDKLWEINVKASILLLKDVAPYLSKGSSVIIISSIGGYHPPASMAMYGVTKTALFGLTKALATELSPDTRVNCIAPGIVPTRFAASITSSPTIRKDLDDKILLKRLGTIGDMAATAAFLASDDSAYITGETLVVAGGMASRL